MDISITSVRFEDNAWTYRLRFEWSASEGVDIRIQMETYHAQYNTLTWADDGVLLDEYGTYIYNMTTKGLLPYYRYVLKVRTTKNYEREFIVDNHPNHPSDSYIKDALPPVHYQYATYKNAYYYYETNSCVSNALCAGMDGCHRKIYGQPLRPSVGYLYGAVEKDKNDDFGMLFESALGHLTSKGVACASIVHGDVKQDSYTYSYPNNYLKQNKIIPNSNMNNITVEGGVQMHNRESLKSGCINSERHAMLSGYVKKNITEEIIEMMNAVKNNNQFVMMCLGVSTEFDSASNGNGVCGRLMKSTSYRMGHACYVIGWKKIGIEYYWILQNSWGDTKGDNGLIYVPFSWFWTSRSNGEAGLWYGYICTYRQNGATSLPVMSSPTLDTLQGKDGRGGNGLLYVKFKLGDGLVAEEIGGYYIRYTDESGMSKEIFTFGDGGVYTLQTGKFGETFKLAIKYRTQLGKLMSDYSAENLATTLPKESTISINKTTSTTVTLNVSVSEGKWTDVAVHMYDKNGYIRSIIIPRGVATCTFDNLKGGEKYTFDAETRYVVRGTTLKSYNKSNQLIVTTGADVKRFYWTTDFGRDISNNTGSDNQWYIYPITFIEWNSYIDTLKKVRELKNITVSRPLNNVSRGSALTPRVNEAINALNDLLEYGEMSLISENTQVSASVFLDLQNKLNNIIDNTKNRKGD